MRALFLAVLTVALLLCGGAAIGLSPTFADEIYKKKAFYEEGSAVTFIAFSQDGTKIAFATEGRIVRIRETVAGNEIALIAVPSSVEDDEDLQLVAFSPDGSRLVTASRDKMVRVWDVDTARQLAELEHPSRVWIGRFSPDGTRLATLTGETTVRLWDVTSGRLLAALEHPAAVFSVLFSPDGTTLATGTIEGSTHIWDVADGSEVMALRGHADMVTDVRFSPDGSSLVTASEDATARIWNIMNGTELLILRHSAEVRAAAFSADGTRIVTGAGQEAHVFDAETGKEIGVLKGHEGEVLNASFSPDGTRIVTGSYDSSVRVWDPQSSREIAVLKGHSYDITFTAFSPDSQRILSVGGAQGIVWTKLESLSLPESVVGLWFSDLGSPQEAMTPEIVRAFCVATPIRINRDGLVVLFEGYDPEPPHPVFHLRCASDLSCEIFSGEPAQGAELFGEGSLNVSGNTGTLCLTGDCRPIARCPAINWTDEERSSGFAAQWEASVQTPEN
jgi:WD40 repeat protein